MLLKRILFLILMPAVGLAVKPEDFSGYKAAVLPQVRKTNLLEDPAFSDVGCWKGLRSGVSIENGCGRNQTSGLKYDRTLPDEYVIAYQNVVLQPGTSYRFGVWIKTEGELEGDGAALCMEHYDRNGSWRSTAHSSSRVTDASHWQWIEGTLATPPEAEGELVYRFSCYMMKGTTGLAFFDDAVVEEIAESGWLIAQTWPTHSVCPASDGKLKLSCLKAGDTGREIVYEELVCLGRLSVDGGGVVERTAELNASGCVTVQFGKLAPGRGELEIIIADPQSRSFIGRQKWPVSIEARDSAGVQIDEHGRTLVNGKPFMPIGLYCYDLQKEDLDCIADSAFNTVLPYGSLDLRFNGSSFTHQAAIREVLDYCEQKGLKLIFALKDLLPAPVVASPVAEWNGIEGGDEIVKRVVESFGDHPAILAWYICDEADVNQLDTLVARRRLMNCLDPSRPSLAVFYQIESIPCYLPCSDILGLDPYPIARNACNQMTVVEQAMNWGERCGMPLWTVPQIYNAGLYDPEVREGDTAKFYREYTEPTEHQMLAIVLREVIAGAKGFIFYSYFDLRPGRGPDSKQFERRWPEVCRVASILKSLEPFILSTAAGPAVTIEPRRGEVRARCLADQAGRHRLLVTGNGPGRSEALLELPEEFGSFQSTTGNTENLGGGRYRFAGENISCDWLIETR